jgi:hypothetical protein
MDTYQERIARYRILYHDELPPEHKAQYRLNGIDPDDVWNLKWSFDNRADAEGQLNYEATAEHKPHYRTYKLVDAGAEEIIERSAWI